MMRAPGVASPRQIVTGGITWNPADKTAALVLSGGNLIATGSAGGVEGVRGTGSGHNTGKFWQQQTAIAVTGEGYIGTAGTASPLNNPGYSDNGVIEFSTGNVITNGSIFSGLFAPIAAGDIVEVCSDIGAKKIWFRVNGGNWNGSPTANPATGVGGLTSNPFGNTIKPYFCAYISTSKSTANFAGPSPISGFAIWS